MRRLLTAGLALALVVGTSGCMSLDEKLVSNLGASYVGTAQGLTDATNSIYAGLRGYGYGDTFYAMEQMGVDTWTAADQISGGGAQNWIFLDTYDQRYNSLLGFLASEWGSAYTIINRANTVLDNGANVAIGADLSQATKDSRLGEAHFLRAWAYFHLIQQFGCGNGPTCGVTVNLHAAQGVSTEATRESEDSVYNVIVADLTEAVNLLPATQSDWGRATKGAAQDLLAKVYLTRAYRPWNTANKQADFQLALDLANTVINSGQYSLVPVYADLWCGMHRSEAPADPGRQGFCDLTNYSAKNPEVIFSVQYSYDPTQYTNTNTNYNHVVFLSRYDNNSDWAAGMRRTADDGRPFRRIRPTPAAIDFFNQTRYANGQGGPGVDVLDTRFDGSYQTVWFANQNASNPTGTCPKCTSGAAIHGGVLASDWGATAGSDTALVYLGYQVPDTYRMSKAYRIGTPCTTLPTEDCGLDNDAKGMYGYMHYPSLKKFQDNLRTGGVWDMNGGKDRIDLRLGETYLIAAEAAFGLGRASEAAQDINVLRTRAACDPAASHAPQLCAVSHKSDPAILVNAGDVTLDLIYDERERELSGEMSRWDDLRRPGADFFVARVQKYNPYAAPNVTAKDAYRPIPQRQIDGVTGPAPYPQNPGW